VYFPFILLASFFGVE